MSACCRIFTPESSSPGSSTGLKFALGPTIVTTRSRLRAFGGYEAIENRPADDLLVGRLIAEQGCEVVLLPYAISTVPDYQSLKELFYKRLRWITVMRHMRPWGHMGLIFTLGLPWALLAVALLPTPQIAWAYLGGYMVVRSLLTLLIGSWGLKQQGVWRKAGARSALGRHGYAHLAHQLFTEVHPLARPRLRDSQWRAGSHSERTHRRRQSSTGALGNYGRSYRGPCVQPARKISPVDLACNYAQRRG